ncbi:hypothetical protein [Azospirillum brasilense]|uniref:hypothetical protein n=1 Tax=Azospirillum brasilense TaxID=192 RepID=UPI0019097358|nr:hypothetical protein [Azospirillum brasilense]
MAVLVLMRSQRWAQAGEAPSGEAPSGEAPSGEAPSGEGQVKRWQADHLMMKESGNGIEIC